MLTVCLFCSTDLPADAHFCLKCGRATDQSASPTMTSPPPMTSPAPMEPLGFSPGDSDSFDHGRFAPGTRLGDRYRVVGRLGVGGMGEVYRADDLKLGQPVALKFLPEAIERDPVSLDRLTAEIRTARQISHPNVCRVYDVGEVDGRRFLTMEYVDGEDLRGLLRRIGRLPEDKGLEIARQICAGLAAIHDRGVLHRDLKPANVMLDGRGKVRLTDFGLATTAAAAGRTGEIAGTPAYMAPEQLTGQPLSVASDMYALGLVLFELFTGERVHKHDRLEEARAGKRSAAASVTLTTSGSGAKLDPVIQRVIERCLDADPKRRPQSAIVVAAALPGGDPLAAALAAGETPSPQMVAASGSEGGLSFKVAVPLLLLVIAGVFVSAWLDGRRSYAALVPFPNSPEILAGKARDMLVRLGYTDTPADTAAGFRVDDAGYNAWLNERDKSATRWQHIASVRPPRVRFWYRTSPRAMTPLNFFGNHQGGGLAVSPADPPMTVPGMTYLQLDPEGRLVSFDAAVVDKVDAGAPAREPDWPALFREAGLDISLFKPATPEWVSRAAADATAAWTGPGADETGAELRAEAAAFQGRPVFFRLIGPWTKSSSLASSASAGSPNLVSIILGITIIVGIPLAAVGLSVRNVRLGRTDTRGAARLAAVAGGTTLAAALLGSHFAADPSWLDTSFLLASWAAFAAVLSWVLYAALEPYVRRQWPQMLISSSRLLDGRWRDPLVGRDVLIGGVLALAMNVVQVLQSSIRLWRGGPPPLSSPVARWEGLHLTVADLVSTVPEAMWVALGLAMFLVLLRLLLRSKIAAAVGFVIIMTVPGAVNNPDPIVQIPFALLMLGSFVVIATRFGLVMLATYLLVDQMSFGGGFAAPGFAQSSVMLTMAAIVALGVFGFYTATRGRKASAWLDG